MPTYDYHCETCGRDFEAYQSFSDDSTPKCPGREEGSCKSRGKGRVAKVFSAPAITFKGSGFYKTDSRSGSSTKSSSSGGTESGSDSSSDASASGSSSSSESSSTSSDSGSATSSTSDTKAAKAKKPAAKAGKSDAKAKK